MDNQDPKPPKPQRLETPEALFAFLDRVLTNAALSGESAHIRLSVPYEAIVKNDPAMYGVKLLLDLKIYYDAELKDERDESGQGKIEGAGKNKTRH